MSLRVIITILLAFVFTEAQAQKGPIVNFPPNNPAHPSDLEQLIPRPRLTMIGFDSPNPNHGLGVKQVLEDVYLYPDPLYVDLYVKIIERAFEDYVPPESVGNINRVSQIFQARAFEALMTYILEKNFWDPYVYTLPSFPGTPPEHTHSAALARFTDMAAVITSETTGDEVHRTNTIANSARAWDLYLALEVAYSYFGDPATPLLTASEKSLITTRNYSAIHDLRDVATDFKSSLQPGNWPMKVKMTAGYGAFGWGILLPNQNDYYDYINDAFASGFGDNWKFENNDDKRYWAEGAYYLVIASGDVLPFWHTMRANGRIPAGISDPFSSTWFLNTWDWLADISLPGGYTPPLDDGNKWPLAESSVLRWSPAYGNNNTLSNSVAEKFAWINENLGQGAESGVGSDADLPIVEINTVDTF